MKMMWNVYGCFMVVSVLMSLTSCTTDELISQITTKTQQNTAHLLQKSTQFSSLTTQSTTLKSLYSQQVNTKTNAEQAYRNYFMEKIRCQGLGVTLDFVGVLGEIPGDFCPVAPVGGEGQGEFRDGIVLGDLGMEVEYWGDLVKQQADFNADVFAQAEIYTRISEITVKHLEAVIQQNKDCLSRYATPSNPNPPQCQKYASQITRLGNQYNEDRGKALSFGRLTKIPMFDLQRKQTSLNTSTIAYSDNLTQILPKLSQLKTTQALCYTNLQLLRTDLNRNLDSALQSSNKIVQENLKILQVQNGLENTLGDRRRTTKEIQGLVVELKKGYS